MRGGFSAWGPLSSGSSRPGDWVRGGLPDPDSLAKPAGSRTRGTISALPGMNLDIKIIEVTTGKGFRAGTAHKRTVGLADALEGVRGDAGARTLANRMPGAVSFGSRGAGSAARQGADAGKKIVR